MRLGVSVHFDYTTQLKELKEQELSPGLHKSLGNSQQYQPGHFLSLLIPKWMKHVFKDQKVLGLWPFEEHSSVTEPKKGSPNSAHQALSALK